MATAINAKLAEAMANELAMAIEVHTKLVDEAGQDDGGDTREAVNGEHDLDIGNR